jgi:hypothetical protein
MHDLEEYYGAVEQKYYGKPWKCLSSNEIMQLYTGPGYKRWLAMKPFRDAGYVLANEIVKAITAVLNIITRVIRRWK